MHTSLKRPPALSTEKRQSLRLDKVFPVWISSSEHGECQAVARNVSTGGIFVETAEPLPLGSVVRIHFVMPESSAEMVAHGEVKNHYFLNYAGGSGGPRSMSGMGIRFTRFEEGDVDSLERSLGGLRVLH
jgi:hypothetical protein